MKKISSDELGIAFTGIVALASLVFLAFMLLCYPAYEIIVNGRSLWVLLFYIIIIPMEILMIYEFKEDYKKTKWNNNLSQNKKSEIYLFLIF